MKAVLVLADAEPSVTAIRAKQASSIIDDEVIPVAVGLHDDMTDQHHRIARLLWADGWKKDIQTLRPPEPSLLGQVKATVDFDVARIEERIIVCAPSDVDKVATHLRLVGVGDQCRTTRYFADGKWVTPEIGRSDPTATRSRRTLRGLLGVRRQKVGV